MRAVHFGLIKMIIFFFHHHHLNYLLKEMNWKVLKVMKVLNGMDLKLKGKTEMALSYLVPIEKSSLTFLACTSLVHYVEKR